ncbi:MAG: ABC-2 family transporter protein [Clostridia bacterium]|nr:ABC-2 family transporter protein [Clostridia bacterium]
MNFRAYRTAFAVHARQVSRYRGAAIGGMVTQAFFGVMLVALYSALAGEGELLRQTATYVWLQQIFFRAFFTTGGEINEQIMSGSVCYSLLRPIDLHFWCVCREMAAKIVGVSMRILPMFLIQFILPENWRMLPPNSLVGFIQFFLSLLIGFCVIAQVNMITAAVTMRTLDNKGFSGLINLVMMILSGNIIPLTLAPERLQAILRWQPFAQMLDAPIRMYLHTASLGEWALSFGVQLAWLVGLTLFSRALWGHNIRRIELQGG